MLKIYSIILPKFHWGTKLFLIIIFFFVLFQHIGNPRANVKETMMKEQGPRLQKQRPSTLTHRTLARFYTNQNDIMEGLVTTIKEMFNNLDCSPQDLRQCAVFGVFLNHIFPVSDIYIWSHDYHMIFFCTYIHVPVGVPFDFLVT